jgi:hypothetical protein
LIPSAIRNVVLTVARAVQLLGLASALAAIVIGAWLSNAGFEDTDLITAVLAFAPPVVLWILWMALKELAELPERLRRLPQAARERRVDVEGLAAELREPGRRFVRLPLALWRMRGVAGAVRDLVTPHAPLLPFLSGTFLTLSALAAVAALLEIAIALVLLIAAVL